jgi:hypothetical protein
MTVAARGQRAYVVDRHRHLAKRLGHARGLAGRVQWDRVSLLFQGKTTACFFALMPPLYGPIAFGCCARMSVSARLAAVRGKTS